MLAPGSPASRQASRHRSRHAQGSRPQQASANAQLAKCRRTHSPSARGAAAVPSVQRSPAASASASSPAGTPSRLSRHATRTAGPAGGLTIMQGQQVLQQHAAAAALLRVTACVGALLCGAAAARGAAGAFRVPAGDEGGRGGGLQQRIAHAHEVQAGMMLRAAQQAAARQAETCKQQRSKQAAEKQAAAQRSKGPPLGQRRRPGGWGRSRCRRWSRARKSWCCQCQL